MVTIPAWFAAANSPMPSGTPSRAPGSAGITCAIEMLALTCRGDAPSARASADARLASSAVAQAVKTALKAARVHPGGHSRVRPGRPLAAQGDGAGSA